MGEEIYETTDEFAFHDLKLNAPSSTNGGNYFLKFSMKSNPLYIQTPKCRTKNGFVKSGKKMQCELMFTNEDESFIRWMENLETHCYQLIFEKRKEWFSTDMEMTDIENYFVSPLKIYKSGKFYLLKINVTTTLGKTGVKIYDENEVPIEMENIQENTRVITILEMQSVKCSARSFQIEVELKQMMVLHPTDLFEKCVIKSLSRPPKNAVLDREEPFPLDGGRNNTTLESVKPISLTVESHDSVSVESADSVVVKESPDSVVAESSDSVVVKESPHSVVVKESLDSVVVKESLDSVAAKESLDSVAVKESSKSTSSPSFETTRVRATPLEIMEVDLELDEIPETETFQIKKRNDVYYKIYLEAKQKAKLAKDLALSAYLEAKRIKNAYMLEDSEEEEGDGE
jgi:hypothetical protein